MMLFPQRSRRCRVFYCLLANDHQRTWLLVHSRPAPLHPAKRDWLYFHHCCVVSVRQKRHMRIVHPRWVSRRNRRVCYAHRDKDSSSPIHRQHHCRGWPPTERCDAASMDGRQLLWGSEAGGCYWNSHRFWEPGRVSLLSNSDLEDRALTTRRLQCRRLLYL